MFRNLNFYVFRLAAICLLGLGLSSCDSGSTNFKESNANLIDIEKLDPKVLSLYKKIIKGDDESLQQISQMAKEGVVDAKKMHGIIQIQGKYTTKNIESGIDELKDAASSGDIESSLILYKIFTSKKYKDSYKEEAQEYGEMAGILKSNNDSGHNIKKLQRQIENNSWKYFKFADVINPNENVIRSGSGVAVNGSGFFITNKHVVENCPNIIVRYNYMFDRAASVLLGDKADIAAIQVRDKTPAFIALNTDNLNLGQKIYVGGYPLVDKLGADLKMTDGLISGAPKKGETLVQISASISSGNSGGPVVDDSNRLIGLATGGISSGSTYSGAMYGYGLNFATHNSAILNFLDENKIPYKGSTSAKVMTSKEIADFLKISTALIICIQ